MIGAFKQLLFYQMVARRSGRGKTNKDERILFSELRVIPQMLLPRQPPANLSERLVDSLLP